MRIEWIGISFALILEPGVNMFENCSMLCGLLFAKSFSIFLKLLSLVLYYLNFSIWENNVLTFEIMEHESWLSVAA